MTRATPPATNELEVSVFGRGVGESIALHLGDGQWAVFDSCLADDGETPAALEYLNEIGVDVSRDVRIVAATHWHDDHIGGLANLLREARSAKFACSAALRSEDFVTLVTSREDLGFVEATTGVDEFYDILEVLQGRNPSKFARGPDVWGLAGMCVYRQSTPMGVELICASPSAQSVTDGFGRIATELLPKAGDSMSRRFPDVRPNEQSMAVLMVSNVENVLLGADLELGRDDFRGWRAVVQATNLPATQSGLIKVAHHGSPNAHHDPAWKKLLKHEPLAVVTAYKAGRRPLPASDDVARILRDSSSAFCTSTLKAQKPPKRRGLEMLINSSVRSRRTSPRRLGQVRIRQVAGQDASVELFGDSCELKDAG